MDYHYAHKYLVGYSDVDRNDRMKLSRIIDLFQNIATWHSKSIGYGTHEMMSLKLGWLVLAWKIKILKYPQADENIEIRTWSKTPKGLHAFRDFEILNENGEPMVLATSSWILYDLEAKRPVRLLKDMIDGYGAIDRNALDEEISKLKDEKIDGETLDIQITKRDIDTNHHVNNAKYVEFFEEMLPENVLINELEIQYKRQTLLGEKLHLTFDGRECTMENDNGDINVIIIVITGI